MFAEENGEPLSRTDINFFYLGAAWQSNIFTPMANVNNLVTQKLDS